MYKKSKFDYKRDSLDRPPDMVIEIVRIDQ
jgi:hypothetical protein